jgi:hypothetical protein
LEYHEFVPSVKTDGNRKEARSFFKTEINMNKKMAVLITASLLTASSLGAQTFVPNYDEAKVPEFTLPDPLIFENGNKVKTTDDWAKRRDEIFRLFEQEVYGVSPQWEGNMKANVVYENP